MRRISIGKARINLEGDIDFRAIVVIRSPFRHAVICRHCFYGFRGVRSSFERSVSINQSQIDQPKLFVKTYANDTVSNLSQFLTKFKRNNAQKKRFDAGIEHLRLNGGIFVLQNETNKSNSYADDINLLQPIWLSRMIPSNSY